MEEIKEIKEIKEINEAITEEIRKMPLENGRKPIPDGITNPKFYADAPKKILFILKEAYDEGKNGHGQGGWDHDVLLNKLKYSEMICSASHRTVSKVSSCILRKMSFSQFSKENLSEEKIMADFRSIAWINVGKYPAIDGTRTKASSLKRAYDCWRPILLKQIESYKPEIIIFGGTFYLFKEDLMNNFEIKEIIAPWVFRDKLNRLYISTGHPAQTQYTDQEYIDSIINAIKTAENKSL